MLSQLQNNVKNIENRMVQFCYYNIPSQGRGFEYYSAIVGQSSSYVKPGEQVEIYAGVGSFSKSASPEITISGKSVALGDDAVAVYKFKASGKAGKYFLPIIISYTDHDGKEQTIEKIVEYTVAKEIDKKD